MSEFIANTTYGQVKGSKKVSVLRTEYLNFLGIPYAAAPIGELRFKVSDKLINSTLIAY